MRHTYTRLLPTVYQIDHLSDCTVAIGKRQQFSAISLSVPFYLFNKCVPFAGFLYFTVFYLLQTSNKNDSNFSFTSIYNRKFGTKLLEKKAKLDIHRRKSIITLIHHCCRWAGWTLDPRVCIAYLVLCFNIGQGKLCRQKDPSIAHTVISK